MCNCGSLTDFDETWPMFLYYTSVTVYGSSTSVDSKPLTVGRLEYILQYVHQVFKWENDLLNKGHKDE
jgi:hypothetical protein